MSGPSHLPSLAAALPCVQILDWDYYIERLGSTIQKIITIPAALQQVWGWSGEQEDDCGCVTWYDLEMLSR